MKRRKKLNSPQEKQNKASDGKVFRLLVLFVTLVMLLIIWSQRGILEHYSKLGLLGIFIVNFLSSATVLFPLPGVATVFLGGAIWNPFMVGLLSGLGASIGEVFGYLVGYGGRGLLMEIGKGNFWLMRVEKAFHKHGFATTLIFSILPMPVFDVIGVIAGALNYSLVKFAFATILGRVIRNIFFAWTGAKIL